MSHAEAQSEKNVHPQDSSSTDLIMDLQKHNRQTNRIHSLRPQISLTRLLLKSIMILSLPFIRSHHAHPIMLISFMSDHVESRTT